MTNAIDNARKALDAYDNSWTEPPYPSPHSETLNLARTLRDLLDSLEYEYGARDTSGRVHKGSEDFATRSVSGNALPDLVETVRRAVYVGEWEKVS